ncbi:MAG: lysophospholipid acyltransferase family protein [Cyclobacteriaceae bacterium]|nr:lysophospholipid acyltransferase family protein [Cyclobacteriaceae bacterium]
MNLSDYRKKIVLENLRSSFPEKTEEEIQSIRKSFFKYLCDLVVETFKTLRMTEAEYNQRCIFQNPDWLIKLREEKRSIIIVMGHYGNWEWAGPSLTLTTKFQLVVIYRPLSNTYFEKMMVGMRTKFGTKITPVSQTLRDMVANRRSVTATALLADQYPASGSAYWANFLNQDTGFFTGPEKLSSKFDYPVVYIHVRRKKRGYYEVTPELLFESPKETNEGEITESYIKRLQADIIGDPSTWLWSHRRWKNKR